MKKIQHQLQVCHNGCAKVFQHLAELSLLNQKWMESYADLQRTAHCEQHTLVKASLSSPHPSRISTLLYPLARGFEVSHLKGLPLHQEFVYKVQPFCLVPVKIQFYYMPLAHSCFFCEEYLLI